MANQAYTSKDNGGLWIAPGGPNTKPEYLPCHDLEDITESNGSITLIQCVNDRGEYETIGSTQAPPEPTTTTLGTYIGKVADWIETVKCPFPLYVMLRGCGKASQFENWERGMLLQVRNVSGRTRSGLVRISEDVAAMHTFDIEAFPGVIDFFRLTSLDMSPDLTALNQLGMLSMRFLDETACWDGCGQNLYGTEVGYITTRPDTGEFGLVLAAPDWTPTAANPFLVDQAISDLAIFKVGIDTTRILVVCGTTSVGNPMKVAYSDDGGTTWIGKNVGATNGEFAVKKGALFAFGKYDIYLVSNLGRIYKSEDGGETWEVKENATITTDEYYAVHFVNPNVGYAVGAGGLVVKTVDGGKTWGQTGSAAGIDDLYSVFVLSESTLWVGSADGVMYKSQDNGNTWSQKVLPGNSANVNDIYFMNPYVAYVANDTVVKFTITGGFSWETISDTANIHSATPLESVTPINNRLVYALSNAALSQSAI